MKFTNQFKKLKRSWISYFMISWKVENMQKILGSFMKPQEMGDNIFIYREFMKLFLENMLEKTRRGWIMSINIKLFWDMRS